MGEKLSATNRRKPFNLSEEFPAGLVPVFAMQLAIMITGPSRPWSDRYLFFPFNYLQRLSTWKVLTALKGIELIIHRYLPDLPCREVDARRREGVARVLSEA
jgi:hypothetical protein